MKSISLATVLFAAALRAGVAVGAAEPAAMPSGGVGSYRGVAFQDACHAGGPQAIPGRIENECYDTLDVSDAQKAAGAGEGIAYHDTDNQNSGSGALNGTEGYLNAFRRSESPDISYVKFDHPGVAIDDSPYNRVKPDAEALYLGWIAPDEWVRYSVTVREAGSYSLTTMYTSKFGGHIAFDCDGVDVSGPIEIPSTFDAADTIDWRQAHHWNKAVRIGRIVLPAGRHVLTLHFLDKPVMNFDYMEFTAEK